MSSWVFIIEEPECTPVRLQAVSGLTLGRGPGNGYTVRDQTVGNNHVQILDWQGQLYIEDLGSKNKTRITNGPTLAKGQRYPLVADLVFKIGRTKIQVLDQSAGGPTATIAVPDLTQAAPENPVSHNPLHPIPEVTERSPRGGVEAPEPIPDFTQRSPEGPFVADPSGTLRTGPSDALPSVPSAPISDDALKTLKGEGPEVIDPLLTERVQEPLPQVPDFGGSEPTIKDSAPPPVRQQDSNESAPEGTLNSDSFPSLPPEALTQAQNPPQQQQIPPPVPPAQQQQPPQQPPQQQQPAQQPPPPPVQQAPPAQEPRLAAEEPGLHARSGFDDTISWTQQSLGKEWEREFGGRSVRLVVVTPVMRKVMRMNRSPFSIGSDPESDLAINNRTLSQKHATIYYRDDGFILQDRNTNGTTEVNGVTLSGGQTIELESPSALKFGSIEMLFVADSTKERKQNHRVNLNAGLNMAQLSGVSAEEVKVAAKIAQTEDRDLAELLLLRGSLSPQRWQESVQQTTRAIARRALIGWILLGIVLFGGAFLVWLEFLR